MLHRNDDATTSSTGTAIGSGGGGGGGGGAIIQFAARCKSRFDHLYATNKSVRWIVIGAVSCALVIAVMNASCHITGHGCSVLPRGRTIEHCACHAGTVRVGCLVVATGKYARYIPALIDSYNRYFLQPERRDHDNRLRYARTKYHLHWFVFSDDKPLLDAYGIGRNAQRAQHTATARATAPPSAAIDSDSDTPSVRDASGTESDGPIPGIPSDTRLTVIEQRRKGWPFDSLQRFGMYLAAEETSGWGEMDYVYAFDADLFAIGEVSAWDVLSDLVGANHPGFPPHKRSDFTYDTHPTSTAYIRPNEGAYYFAGGWVGGRTGYVRSMFIALNENIGVDMTRGVMADWHDESHVNRYFVDHPPTLRLPHGLVSGESHSRPGTPLLSACKLMNINKNHTDMRFGCADPHSICHNTKLATAKR